MYGKSTQGTFPVYYQTQSQYIQWVSTLSLTIRYIFIHLALVASEMCEIPRNSPKIRTYCLRSSKVIDLGVNRKLTCSHRASY